jgi:hypothetical protein
MAYKQWAKELLKIEMYGHEATIYGGVSQPMPPKEFWPSSEQLDYALQDRPGYEDRDQAAEEMARRAWARAKHAEMFPPKSGSSEWFSRKAKAEWISRKVDELIEQNPEVVK